MTNTLASSPWLTSPDWNSISAASVTATPRLNVDHTELLLELDELEFRLHFYDWGLRLCQHPAREPDYQLIKIGQSKSRISIELGTESATVTHGDLKTSIGFSPFTLSVVDSENGEVRLSTATDGHFVRQHRVPPLARTERGWITSLALNSDASVYGLGEKWGNLNKRGQLVRSYNSDALGVNAEISYKNTPFCWSPEGWGVLFNTPSPVTHAVGHASWSQRSYCAELEDHHLDVFLFIAHKHSKNNALALIKNYTELTGTSPVPPEWGTGVILSKAYYRTADEILQAARDVRDHGMPCDVITFDGRAWQDTRTRFSFTWDETRYPDPKPVVDQLKDMGFKICVWEYPLISVENPWFKLFADNGWLLTDSRSGDAYQYEWDMQAFGEVLTALPKSGIVDFTHPQAYAFWRDAHKPLFDLGVDMIKADFGEQVECEYMQAANGESGRGLHNVYAYLYNQCVYEAAQKYSASGPFLFSRASWIGCQQFNSQWGGDPQADFEGMMASLRGGLSWGLSGAPFYATDVGGFYKDTRDDTLYVRWAQMAIFSAHFRLHGIGAREPWSYSDQASAAVMSALKLRYRLLRYLQRALEQASLHSIPVQRAMVLAFPEEQQSWAFENQFMFGEDLLVAPCFRENGQVDVYLPEGEWCLFEPGATSRQYFNGGRLHRLFLELDQIAVFARAGAQIPLNTYAETTADIPRDEQGLFEVQSVWNATL